MGLLSFARSLAARWELRSLELCLLASLTTSGETSELLDKCSPLDQLLTSSTESSALASCLLIDQGRGVIETMSLLRTVSPSDPSNPRFEKLNTPPSPATIR